MSANFRSGLVAAVLTVFMYLLVGLTPYLVHGATISSGTDNDGVPLITIVGDFVEGDDLRFNNMAVLHDRARVVFQSRGGLAVVGMAIGRTIAIKDFETGVASNSICASACGLAWLAGRPRTLMLSSKVGFHAVYLAREGRQDVSSSGNALVGGYLRDIGLSDTAIVYVTQAQPQSMSWLTEKDAVAIGLDLRIKSDDPTPIVEEAVNIPIPEARPFHHADDVGKQLAYYYVETVNGSTVAQRGFVKWKSKGNTISADVDFPGPGIQVFVSFRDNERYAQSADAFIDLHFTFATLAEGDGVISVQRMSFKQTERERGDALMATPLRVDKNIHLFALSKDGGAHKLNTDLMRRWWIDIPILYANNQRALITFEKGWPGTNAFNEVLPRWSAD
jgi:hypothetical protein